ncbi:hypothetical protein [Vibrio coralliilyticus]|uniref:hypothetical protein n=1 Tax=Vibrio coralliilyticus TaxID=190893 RepID=UPI000BAB0BE3|nr:hypothetical protein [Vibrio coralliilyticus]NOI60405.1 hypothetical protein [Vibrio coralliilyticus]PAT67404.1 hypothetical protein CKA27_14005 [Vibrio coralliilyticus]
MNNIELIRKNRLANEIIFADGIGSSGKGMLSHIIASFERVEKQRNDMIFDTIPRMYDLGKISKDAAVVLMQTEADQQLYHTMMSRAVNFRPTDSTGVTKNPFPMRYFKRLFMREGDDVVKRIHNERPIFNQAPHDALKNSQLLFDTFGDKLKIVYIVRNPVELVHDWERRGFGNRIGVDPREFQFSYEYGDDIVPLYAQGWEDEYHSISSVDRNIMMVKHHYYNNLTAYQNLEEKYQKNVLIITFDELVSNPFAVSENIADFMCTKTTRWTKKIIAREGCPREAGNKITIQLNEIKAASSKNYFDELEVMLDNYTKNFVNR